jgi:hypothetical protein
MFVEEGSFCDEQEKAHKPVIVTDDNQHMGYIEKGDRMANSHSISWEHGSGGKKILFHHLELTILNNYNILSSCSGTADQRKFCLA